MDPERICRIIIDANATRQTFDGWGTSLAWFAHRTGEWHNREELADLLFASPDECVSLGFTIARYNIGGGDHPSHAGRLRPGADVPSWRPDPAADYDWSADPRQRWWLRAAAERAGDGFVADAIAYSAPWWMTASGRSNGYLDGTVDHLLPGNESAFATYLADVVEHVGSQDGIAFRTLSPLNEPGTDYWKAQTRQEGMRVSPGAPQRRVLDATFDALRARGLRTGLSAVDETGVDLALGALRALEDAGFDRTRTEQINVHTYISGDRVALHELAVGTWGKRLQMSEVTIDGGPYAPQTIEPSLAWAAHLTTDLTKLQPSEYVYWQAVEAESDTVSGDGNWGFIHDRTGKDESFSITKKFHAMRQYTNFIRPGAVFLETSSDSAVAAIDADGQSITIVIYNDAETPERVHFDIEKGVETAGRGRAFRTSGEEDVADLGTFAVRGRRLEATLAPRSITTFVVDLLIAQR